jgi:hypothetical protein
VVTHAVTLRTQSACWLALAVLALSGCASGDSVTAPVKAPSKTAGSPSQTAGSPSSQTVGSPSETTGSTVATSTTKLAYPSEEFPAQPAINFALTLQIPKDWKALPTSGTVMATRRIAEDSAFTPNVIVRVESRKAGYVVADALAEVKAYAATKPQGVTSTPVKSEMGGRQFEGCIVSWVSIGPSARGLSGGAEPGTRHTACGVWGCA